MMLNLNDPRLFTHDYPATNIVINQALQVVQGEVTTQELQNTLSNLLKNENDALINVALNLSPNLETSQIIWRELHHAINIDSKVNDMACIFAIPIVIVAGSKKSVKLINKIDVDSVNKFFVDNEIIKNNSDCFISGKLIDPQNIARLRFSQLHYWVRNIQQAKLWLPIDVEAMPIMVENEGVFLRFLVGVATQFTNQNQDVLNDIINFEQYKSQSMKFMQYLVNELKTDGVTLFPIPFAPVYLSTSFAIGDNYRKEIAISVALSNIVRKIRESSLTPIVNISTVDSGIEIRTSTKEISELNELSVWNLTQYDDFLDILHKITILLQEMNVEYTSNN